MKQYRSDGRYLYHNKGLVYIAEFRWNNRNEHSLFVRLRAELRDIYGPESDTVFDAQRGVHYRQMNENWRSEQNFRAKRRRIYLREESALSLALLRIN